MRYIAIALSACLLAGCATDLGVSAAADAERAKFVTKDPQELRARWGAYADLAGKAWLLNQYDGRRFTWVVPSVVLVQESFFWGTVSHLRIEYDPATKALRVRDQRDDRYIRSAEVRKDGSVAWESNWFFDWDETTIRFDAAAREAVWQDTNGARVYKEVASSLYAAADAEAHRLGAQARAQIRADKAAEDAKSAAFWNNLSNGVSAATKVTAQAYAQARAQSSSTSPLSAQTPTTQAPARSPVAAQVGPTTFAQPTTGTAVGTAIANTPNAGPFTQAYGASQGKVAPSTAVRSDTHNESRSAPVPERGPKPAATPEAIMVCTHPSGPKASFECSTPVTVHRGHAEDISGHRTPEQMVASSSAGCPSPRRLPSTTHLVWGCGFGATNNSNSLDRSAGVDVKGRNTYYCYDKQTSCRRTDP